MGEKTLYQQLGGYDAIVQVVDALLSRLTIDERLSRFWQHRGTDSVAREKQLLIDYLVSSAGGPLHYAGRDMKRTHAGMKIGSADWEAFLKHLRATLAEAPLEHKTRDAVVEFVSGLRGQIVE